MPSAPPRRTVFVTGANGFIGNAVCRSFVRAGWTVYGLVRRPEACPELAAEEIIPVLGSPADPQAFLPVLLAREPRFDVIVSATEQWPDYEGHFAHVVALIQALADASSAQQEDGAAAKPLVLFTSGCKDYGTTALHGSPGLAPHTEASPLNAPDLLRPRTVNSLKIFDLGRGAYDAVLVRPTTVYGRSGSFYGLLLDLARLAREQGRPLRIPAPPDSIMHGTHVDDCGDAYVALAECAGRDRRAVAGQCFNVSGRRYETVGEVGEALAREFGLERGGVVYEPRQEEGAGAGAAPFDSLVLLTDFPQWVGSDKLREVTGWKDRRPLFSENLAAYRVAYEEFVRQGSSSAQQIGKNTFETRFK